MNSEKNRFKRRLKYIYLAYTSYRLSWILPASFCLFEITESLETRQPIISNGNMTEKRSEDSLKKMDLWVNSSLIVVSKKLLIFKLCFTSKLSYHGGIQDQTQSSTLADLST